MKTLVGAALSVLLASCAIVDYDAGQIRSPTQAKADVLLGEAVIYTYGDFAAVPAGFGFSFPEGFDWTDYKNVYLGATVEPVVLRMAVAYNQEVVEAMQERAVGQGSAPNP
ncbi:MAG: hypothetical protein AAGA96_10115 [Verrucomicrobiota bacterium]